MRGGRCGWWIRMPGFFFTKAASLFGLQLLGLCLLWSLDYWCWWFRKCRRRCCYWCVNAGGGNGGSTRWCFCSHRCIFRGWHPYASNHHKMWRLWVGIVVDCWTWSSCMQPIFLKQMGLNRTFSLILAKQLLDLCSKKPNFISLKSN